MAFSLVILLPDDQLYIDLNITEEQLYFLENIVGNKHLCPLTFLRSWKCSNGELKPLGNDHNRTQTNVNSYHAVNGPVIMETK